MKCGKPANVEYIWANERKYACEYHARQIETIGNAIGIATSPRLIIPTDTCPNELSREEEEERKNENNLD